MKKLILLAILFNGANAYSQDRTFPVKGRSAEVLKWGSLSIIIGSSFFDATQDSIISKIGISEFEEMKEKCSTAGWPEGFYQFGLDEVADSMRELKMGRLKMYGIGSYRHIYNGQLFERYIIIRVPYEENKNWDPEIKWEGNIYFLLKENDVKLND